MMQGATIDAATVTPTVVTHSTGEAEYCTAALAIMSATHYKKLYMEFMGLSMDQPLTIALGIDSKAAADIAASPKDTKRTRHIQRRYHLYREAIASGLVKQFYIPGGENWANGLTKPEVYEQLSKECEVYQVMVTL